MKVAYGVLAGFVIITTIMFGLGIDMINNQLDELSSKLEQLEQMEWRIDRNHDRFSSVRSDLYDLSKEFDNFEYEMDKNTHIRLEVDDNWYKDVDVPVNNVVMRIVDHLGLELTPVRVEGNTVKIKEKE